MSKWYLNGKLHREDCPATELKDCQKEFYYKAWASLPASPRVDGPVMPPVEENIIPWPESND
jgi:hypothetical protein